MTLLNAHPERYSDVLRANMRTLAYSIDSHIDSGVSILRPKQSEAVIELSNDLKLGTNRAEALIMPTAVGKTVIAAQLSKAFLAINPNKKILFIAHDKESVRNTRSEFLQFAGIKTGVYYQDEKDLNSNVIVATMDRCTRGRCK